jgi:hypothetical protein
VAIDYLGYIPYYIPCNQLSIGLIDEKTLEVKGVENLSSLRRVACEKCLLMMAGKAFIRNGNNGNLICELRNNQGAFSRPAIDFSSIRL